MLWAIVVVGAIVAVVLSFVSVTASVIPLDCVASAVLCKVNVPFNVSDTRTVIMTKATASAEQAITNDGLTFRCIYIPPFRLYLYM